MNPLITLTTDFGTQDGYAGAMKGRILSLLPGATLIDISHDIEPQSILAASWCIVRSAPAFPPETVHIAVVDPGVGSDRNPVIIRSNCQWFVGPDNGIFTGIVKKFGAEKIFRLLKETNWWRSHKTFDGLHLFAPAGAMIASGISPEILGDPMKEIIILKNNEPVIKPNSVEGSIVLFDRFGNAATNIHSSSLIKFREIKISCNGIIFHFSSCYSVPGTKKPVGIINSDNLLELSIYQESVKEKLGLRSGDRVYVVEAH